MKLSIIVPAHNEEDNIADVVSSIEEGLDFPFELIIVNDHSSDRTPRIVAQLAGKYDNISLIDNVSTPGFANAIKAGLYRARAQAIVPVMGDLCDELKTIPAMLEKIEQGYDVVCGARYIKGGARIGGSRLKGFFSCFVGRSLALLAGIPTHDVANAFKMYRKKVIDSINIESNGFEISMEMALKAHFQGFKVTEVPTLWRERKKGRSSFKMFNLSPDYSRWYLWAIAKKLQGK